MKSRTVMLFWCYSVAATIDCYGQDSTTHRTVFPCGISIQAGIAHFAIRDEHISGEKYAGPSSSISLLWSWFHETYGFQIGITYEKAPRIKNYNVSAEVTQGTLTLATLYPIGKGDLFGNDVFAYIGPSAEAFVYYWRQNIAQNTDASPDVYQSGAWLLSLGARVEVILPFRGGLQLEGALQASLLSIGGGTGSGTNNSTPITLLTALAGVRGTGEIDLRYYLLASVSVAAGYRLEVTRIDSWNYILASSDNAFASLEYHF